MALKFQNESVRRSKLLSRHAHFKAHEIYIRKVGWLKLCKSFYGKRACVNTNTWTDASNFGLIGWPFSALLLFDDSRNNSGNAPATPHFDRFHPNSGPQVSLLRNTFKITKQGNRLIFRKEFSEKYELFTAKLKISLPRHLKFIRNPFRAIF